MEPLIVTPTLIIPASELAWTSVRSSGPGGQNVNKVATKVALSFDVEHSAVLGDDVKARLRVLARHRLDATGSIVILSQSARTQPRNLELAREKLAELVRAALVVPRQRRKTRPTTASRVRRLGAKRRLSDKKACRGPVRFED